MGFNWGSAVPDRITLEDGTEVAVPCDALDGDNYGCGGENSDGNRIRRRENSERRKVKDKLETIPFLAFSEKGRTTTLKVSVTKTSFPQTRRPTTQRMRTQRRTTQIKKTTTKSRKAKPVQFSLTDFSSINESIVRPNNQKQIKKTTISVAFGRKLRTSRTSTEHLNIWSSKEKTAKVTAKPKIVEDRPIWG